MAIIICLAISIAIVAGTIIWQNQLRKAEWKKKNDEQMFI